MNKRFTVERKGKITEFSSVPAVNPFSPSWKFTLWSYTVTNGLYLENLKTFLLGEEKNIINSHSPYNDGGTGLGTTTVTSRFNSFNLFNYNNSYTNYLKTLVKDQLTEYLKQISPETLIDENFKPMITCWFNVMSPGEEIKQHSHNLLSTSFLSGHFTVACEDSYTYYMTPISKNRLEFVNFVGSGTLFPSYLEHGTSVHRGTDKRITIAFDLYYNIDQAEDTIKSNLMEL